MPRAANRSAHDEALDQRGAIVRADGADREYLIAASDEQNWLTARMPEQHRSIRDCRKPNSLGEIRPAQFGFYLAHLDPLSRAARRAGAGRLYPARVCLIFLFRHVLLGLGEQLDRLVKAVRAREFDVDRDVIMSVLSVINRGARRLSAIATSIISIVCLSA
jgi:hypothetical protein